MEDKRGLQTREFGGTVEIKSLDLHGRFAGYASVFDVVDHQRDRVRVGAFQQSLKARLPQLLWQHQWENPIGIIEEIFEDDRGLYVRGRLLMEVEKAREAYALLKAGALRGLSIGYQAKQARRDPDTGVRELLQIELFEISIVTMPANAQANVTVLKQAQPYDAALLYALEQAEQVLRE
jgi:HK97 family phage prohead protease